MNIEQQRAAFEAWASEGFHLARGLNGDYRAVITQIAWACWQAAIELDRQGRGEPVLSPEKAGVLLAGLHRFSIQEERIAARELIAALSAPQPAEPVVKESLTVAEPVKEASEDFENAIDAVSKAMSRAWQLGQTYWQQADSESWSQNKKSDATQEKFNALVDETRALLARYGGGQSDQKLPETRIGIDGVGGEQFSLRWAVETIYSTFKRDLDQGYKTKDKEFAVSIAGKALEYATQPAVSVEQVEDAIQLLRKYRRLCVEIPRGDGYHLQRIDNAIESLAAPVPAQSSVATDEITASEAVYAFAAWLTTRDQAVTFSATHDAAIAAELVSQFIANQRLTQPRENYAARLNVFPVAAPTPPAARQTFPFGLKPSDFPPLPECCDAGPRCGNAVCDAAGGQAQRDDRSDWCRINGCSHKNAGSPVWETQPAQQDADTADAERPKWMTCESRLPWVTNSLKHHIKELRDAEKRSRNAFKKDYMGEPARYFADACGEAAEALERRLSVIDAAIQQEPQP